ALPLRLVIELAATDRQSFETAAAASNVFGLSAKRPRSAALVAPAPTNKPVIVLDPRHGGVARGASSGYGDVGQDIARGGAAAPGRQAEPGRCRRWRGDGGCR